MNQPERVYLDYAAATPLDPRVELAMEPFLRDQFANPSSLYAEGRDAKRSLESARKRVAKALGAKVGEITFTAGATEAINLVIQGVHKSYPQAKILALTSEHRAVLANLEAAGGQLIPVKKNGRINRDQLKKLLDDNVVMVCVALVNSELGTIQPLSDLAAMITQIRAARRKRGVELPLYLMSDASAAAGHVSLQVSRLGVDLMILNGAKFYGPKQSGGLYVRAGTKVEPVILGGGQERGRRSGSEAVAQVIGLATALELAEATRSDELKRQTELRRGVLTELEQIPGFSLNNSQHAVPSIINFRISGQNGEDLLYSLDAAGFAVATGAACSASSDQPSHVLLAIGLTAEQANESLRISLGRSTTRAQLQQFARALIQLAAGTIEP